ncbi:hypothetical protein [Peptococcus simiae]|uniref:hypothetical protein n=1 Tax=Peptococcus simiae TaxID=1643805 RepID=UPI003980F4C4
MTEQEFFKRNRELNLADSDIWKIVTKNEEVFLGPFSCYTSAADNDPNPAEVCLYGESGEWVIPLADILSIEKHHE